jgi:hypothetical protein
MKVFPSTVKPTLERRAEKWKPVFRQNGATTDDLAAFCGRDKGAGAALL